MKLRDFGYICNTIDNGIIILDKDLEVHFWNKWLESRTKISFDEIKNKKVNFNNGKKGRGKDMLSKEQKNKIEKLTQYYDDVNFEQIGL